MSSRFALLLRPLVGPLLLVLLVAVGALGWFLQSRGVTPRLLGAYLEGLSDGRIPPVVFVGQRVNALFTWLDRGRSGGALPIVVWAGAVAEPQQEPAISTVLVGTPEQLIGAIQQARPGDVISLLPGTYHFAGGSISVTRPGREDAPITVRAARAGTVFLEFDILEGFHVSAPWWIFENLHIRGVCSNHSDCEHVFHVVGEATHFVARNNTLVDFNAHFKINGEGAQPDNGIVANNTIVNNSVRRTANPVTSIDLVGASNWVIRGNLIRDFIKGEGDRTSYGGFAKGAGSGNRFVGNTVLCEYTLRDVPGRRVGLSLGGGGTNAASCRDERCIVEQERGVLESNLIAYCSDNGIYLNRASQSLVRHNSLIDTAGILLSFSETSADLDGNLVDGPISVRGDGILRDNGNMSTHVGWLYLGRHPVRDLFTDVGMFDLSWRSPPPRREKSGVEVADLCAESRPATPVFGAFENFQACLGKH